MKNTSPYCDAEMSTVRTSIENYVLGNSAQEQKRLRLQARFLEKWTEQFLLSAGLEPGMRVLDLGCGMGDVSLLAARLVGRTGHVTGIDRDVVVIEKACERARFEGCGADIQFIQSDLFDFHSPRKFDAVTNMEGELVREAIRQLPDEAREIILLREYEEMSYQEIADLLDCPLGTVMSRLGRARARLRILISQMEEPASWCQQADFEPTQPPSG